MTERGDVTHLGPREVRGNHPFSDPSFIAADLHSVRYLVDQLCMFLEMPHLYANRPRPIVEYRPSPGEWMYRLVATQPERLMALPQITFVGFLGQRRSDADVAEAGEFDEILLGEFPEHDDLLSYNTIRLISGNYSNLVLFANEEAKLNWSRSRAHAQAVGKLSPRFYESVRLYNGLLPAGLKASDAMRLTRVKYFDYQSTPMWQAVREFPE